MAENLTTQLQRQYAQAQDRQLQLLRFIQGVKQWRASQEMQERRLELSEKQFERQEERDIVMDKAREEQLEISRGYAERSAEQFKLTQQRTEKSERYGELVRLYNLGQIDREGFAEMRGLEAQLTGRGVGRTEAEEAIDPFEQARKQQQLRKWQMEKSPDTALQNLSKDQTRINKRVAQINEQLADPERDQLQDKPLRNELADLQLELDEINRKQAFARHFKKQGREDFQENYNTWNQLQIIRQDFIDRFNFLADQGVENAEEEAWVEVQKIAQQAYGLNIPSGEELELMLYYLTPEELRTEEQRAFIRRNFQTIKQPSEEK